MTISPSIPRMRYTIKRKILKTFSVISAALVIASFCVIFQAHATPTSGVQIQVVDSLGNAGHDCSLVLDPTGGPHISYRDGNNNGLKYASWNGETWSIKVVDSGGVTGSDGTYSSLSLDSNGNPHISYCAFDETRHGCLKYAWWDGAGWNTQTVDPVGAGWFTSLALDSAGNPHISYYGYYSLQYASWDGSKWEIEIVDPGKFAYDDSMVSIGWHSSVVIDSSDNPHISYYHKTNGDLKYAFWNGSGWEVQTVDSAGDVGLDTSLALDSNGYPHISYFDGVTSNLRYALWNGSSWVTQTVDALYNVGWCSSLAMDSDNRAHISYYDASNGDLRYVCSPNASGFPPQPSSTPWSTLHQEKMMSFLSDTVGLDLTKYTLTTRALPQSLYMGIPQDANYIILSSDQSYLRVLFEFVNGNVRTVNLLDNTGTPQMKKPAGTPLETARGFMSNYQAFTGDSFYGTLRSMLDGVSGGEDYTQTLGNVKFDLFISGTGDHETFGWTYTYNGITALPKGVFLTYQNGFFKMFMDNWNLYTIGSTVVNLSEEEAKSIAINASKQFGHELSGEVNANLFFCPAYSADKPRGQDPLTFYLAWHVEVEYVKWSDYITGVTVDIWADTKEIIHVQEAKIMIKDNPSPEPSPSPDPSSTSNPSSDSSPTTAPSSSSSRNTSEASSPITDPTTALVAPEFPPWIVLPPVMIATLAGGLIYRKKNMKGGET